MTRTFSKLRNRIHFQSLVSVSFHLLRPERVKFLQRITILKFLHIHVVLKFVKNNVLTQSLNAIASAVRMLWR